MVAAGCIVAAIGIFALSRASTTTPFALTAFGYVLCGGGFSCTPVNTRLTVRPTGAWSCLAVMPGFLGALTPFFLRMKELGKPLAVVI